jgi:branched-chain amino acid transport system substrate-binding protein
MALLLAGCGGGDSATEAGAGAGSGDIVIGVPVGLSGANSVVAPSVVQASELAVDEINKAGGVLGRKIKLKVYDDRSGAEGAAQAFTTAIIKDKVAAIVAMETSSARNAGQPIAAKTNTPYIYTSPYEGAACGANLFLDGPVPVQMVEPSAQYFAEKFQAKTWFLIGSDYAYGRGQLAHVRSVVEAAGGKVVGEEYNPVDASDWSSILQKVRSAKPDAIATATAGGAPNVSFLKQWKQGGFEQPSLNLSLDEGTAETIGAAAEGVYFPSQYFTGIESEKNRAFLEALKAKFGAEAKTPNFLSVPQYYGIHLYALAVEKAGSTTSAAVIKALPTVSFDGPAGPVSMNKQHHAGLNIWLGQADATGKTQITEDFGAVDPGAQCPDLK